MPKRSWRNFDFLLLGGVLLLSAYGVIMIYSATINTSGIGNPTQRQSLYLGIGTLLLLLVASIDYRLLDILQHPFPILTPIILSLMNAVVLMALRAEEMQQVQGESLTSRLFVANWSPLVIGAVLVMLVFASDRAWLVKPDLASRRLLAVFFVLVLAGAGALLITRVGPSRTSTLIPFLVGPAIALLYLLDCLTLRVTDILRNPLYVFMLVLLTAVFEIGQIAGGAQSWLGAGAVQPSEMAKLVVIVVLAKFLADREEQLEQFSTVLISLAIVAVPMALIYLQPDLGTAMIFAVIWAAMMWVAGMRMRHWLILAAGGITILPLVWLTLQDYMRQRLLLFINPSTDPDSYFNIHQALVGIGSGGLTGKGLTHGTQSQLHFLRVRHTDFIFAVTAEELGLLGAMAMIGLLFLILWRTLRIAERSRDTFGRLIAAGVAAVILCQAVINIGMNLGLLPVTGLPLPFVSYGGSSYVMLMLGIGLVESVALRHKKLEFD
jgi:rod shape determining protein RodA